MQNADMLLDIPGSLIRGPRVVIKWIVDRSSTSSGLVEITIESAQTVEWQEEGRTR